MIKEEEPPKPSTRLSDSGEALASISANRHTEPAKLTKLMRGELDWIVMKSLEKDRNRRYETANGFAQDVQRYLADEPVQACPPSARYRLQEVRAAEQGAGAGRVVGGADPDGGHRRHDLGVAALGTKPAEGGRGARRRDQGTPGRTASARPGDGRVAVDDRRDRPESDGPRDRSAQRRQGVPAQDHQALRRLRRDHLR